MSNGVGRVVIGYLLGPAVGLAAGLAAAWVVARRRTTERKRAQLRRWEMERALEDERSRSLDAENRASVGEAWYRSVLNNTRDMVFVYAVTAENMPGRFVEVNEVACSKLGYSREKLLTLTPLEIEKVQTPGAVLGFTRSELVTLSDAEVMDRENTHVRVLVKQILERQQVVYEREFVTRDGQEIPVEVYAYSVAPEGSAMIMLTARDVTERNETRQSLRASQRRFRDFFAHSPIGVALYDAGHRLVNVNRACLRMFGVPDRAEFERFNLFDNPFLPGDVKEKLSHGETVRCETAFDFDEVKRLGLFVTRRKGKAHFDMLISNLGFDKSFNPNGYLAQVQDFTTRRTTESALQQSERQLRQAQKMEAIGTLAGGIAHDFNNILTPIIGYTEMMLQTMPENDVNAEYLGEVLKASRRAKDLVNQILRFSRQTEPEGKPIRLTPIVKEVLALLRASLSANIEVRRIIKTDCDVVLADPTQIHQVLMNICSNAGYVMRESGGELELRMTDFLLTERGRGEFPDLAPGRYVRLSVRDTGCGMDRETMERIFEPFYTTKKAGDGTGMGLAVVHGIVSSLKGSIDVESAPGRGATFHVVLPVQEEPEAGTADAHHRLPTGTECVLFVDDEDEIVRMAAHMLVLLGYEPIVTTESAEALRLFSRDPRAFDIVVTDQKMPRMSGSEMAAEMRRVRPDVPIVMITGFGEGFSREEAQSAGMNGYLAKPIDMKAMAETLRRVLDASPRDAATGIEPVLGYGLAQLQKADAAQGATRWCPGQDSNPRPSD